MIGLSRKTGVSGIRIQGRCKTSSLQKLKTWLIQTFSSLHWSVTVFALHSPAIDNKIRLEWKRTTAEHNSQSLSHNTHFIQLHRNGEIPAWGGVDSLINQWDWSYFHSLQGIPFIMSFMIPGSAFWDNLPVYFFRIIVSEMGIQKMCFLSTKQHCVNTSSEI